jgi:hypothetical protein
VYGADTSNKANVQIWNQNTSCAQRWKIRKNADNTYTFLNVCSNKALDVNGAGTVNKTNVQIYTDSNTKAQKWNIVAF